MLKIKIATAICKKMVEANEKNKIVSVSTLSEAYEVGKRQGAVDAWLEAYNLVSDFVIEESKDE